MSSQPTSVRLERSREALAQCVSSSASGSASQPLDTNGEGRAIPLRDLTVELADYSDPRDAADLLTLLDSYARDPMGGGAPLADEVRDRIVPGLAATPGAFSLIARLDGEAVGLANCFTAFSTFAARPLVNVHDLAVLPDHRGRGIAKALLAAIEAEAARRGACKVTLEVLSGNEPAKALYRSLGYANYALDPAAGTAQFWEKKLA